MFLRDGLQSISTIYPLEKKIFFFNNLYKCNIKNIEFGSTTNKKLLPQMSNSFELWEYIKDAQTKDVNLTMLITDKISLLKSLDKNIKSFGLISSVTDLFGMNNMKMNSDKSFENMIEQFNIIYDNNFNVYSNINSEYIRYHTRLYLSCSFGDKNVEINDIFLNKLKNYISKIYDKIKLYNLDYQDIDIVLCDTMFLLDIEIFKKVLNKIDEINGINKYISLHLHTNENFYEYIDIALSHNIYKFDSSLLNIGGCPFSNKKNIGNINTLDLALYLEKNNYDTGINIELLKVIEKKIKNEMNINQ
jgi:isopropylmalate/homocitrate/citramalate synthase